MNISITQGLFNMIVLGGAIKEEIENIIVLYIAKGISKYIRCFVVP